MLPAAPEILECRIAPAVFFLSATAKTVVDATGTSANNAAAQTLAASDVAVLLKTGDSLVLDLDGDHIKDAGETVLVSLSGGKAMVFARDTNADGGFDLGEITGIAAGTGIKATLGTDIAGPIVTSLRADDTVGDLSDVGAGSIASITSTGTVEGIYAGGSISNVKLGTGISTTAISVDTIAAGNRSAGYTLSYAANATVFTTSFGVIAGQNGASISNLTLPNGFRAIYAGDGSVGTATGNGGNGGSVSKVTVSHVFGVPNIFAGDGGTSAAANGGKGGALSGITITATPAGTGQILLQAGNGGTGAKAGGAGGSVSTTSLTVTAREEGILVGAGHGGAGGTGSGGAGGSVFSTTLITAGDVGFVDSGTLHAGTLGISAGAGGATVAGTGGAGGSISSSSLQALNPDTRITNVSLFGGAGGSASGTGRGGAGGSITGTSTNIIAGLGHLVSATLSGGFLAVAGSGGNGSTGAGSGGSIKTSTFAAAAGADFAFSAGNGGVANVSGKGGAGGGFDDVKITVGAAVQDFSVTAGLGGNGAGGGGAGGGLAKVTARSGGSDTGLVAAGSGGSSTGTAAGGAGGSILGLVASFAKTTRGASVLAGTGGNGGTGASAGGSGGSVDFVDMTTGAVTASGADVLLAGGSGGNGGPAGKGGSAGGVSRAGLTTNGDVNDRITLRAGKTGTSNGVLGPNGANVSRVAVTNNGAATAIGIYGGAVATTTGSGNINGASAGSVSDAAWNNYGGTNVAEGSFINTYGGAGGIGTGKGGNGGSLTRITVNSFAAHGYVGIGEFEGGGNGGTTGTGGAGGNGGSSSSVTINDFIGGAESVRIEVYGGKGGAGGGTNGKGGNSGSISTVAMNAPKTVLRLYSNEGGNAGSGASAKGGNSGSVSNITGLAGELRLDTGRGGDAPNGSGGNAGAISKITATVTDLVRRIVGGNGGSGAVAAGSGGAISSISVTGDIGDFGSAFGWGFSAAMGGISPGLGGSKGSTPDPTKTGTVATVSATRIASIIAGAPANNAITATNAVPKITGITTAVLGADINGDGVFTFTNAGAAGFTPGDGDTAIDGLVLVKTGGFTITTVQPLIVVTV